MGTSLKFLICRMIEEQGFRKAPEDLQLKNGIGITFFPYESTGEGNLWICFTEPDSFFMSYDILWKKDVVLEGNCPELLLISDENYKETQSLRGYVVKGAKYACEIQQGTRKKGTLLGFGETFYKKRIPQLLGRRSDELEEAVRNMDGLCIMPKVQRLFFELRDYVPLGSAAALLYEAKFLELTAAILEWEQKEDTIVLPESVSMKDYEEIKKVRERLREHYVEHVDLQDLAQACYMSKSKLTNLFKAMYGTTIYDYVLSLRMERAKELMEDRSLKIGEIAEQAGYGKQSSFSSIFRQKTGMTPNEYRKRI